MKRIMNNDLAMAQLYLSGLSLDEVAAFFGLNCKTVRRHLVAQGVPLRSPNNVKRSEWLMEKIKDAAV